MYGRTYRAPRAMRKAPARGRGADGAGLFPLSIHSSGRYLCSPGERAFLIHGDSPWSLEVQLTGTQIDTYLSTRASQGFTAVLFEAFEHKFSSQSPAYTNASDGANPFTSQPGSTDFSTTNNTYWNTVDYIVQGARKRGIVCFIAFAYMGFSGGAEGWTTEINGDTAGHLQTYGAFLANRYGNYGNIVWVAGGDYSDSATITKQANIMTGYLTVRSDMIVCGHPARGEDAYNVWGPGGQNFSWWNCHTTYCSTDGSDSYSLAATAYGRVKPFVLIEGGYEGEHTLGDVRRTAYGTVLSGGCGHFFGNNPVWSFGDPNDGGGVGAASVISNNLNSTGATQMRYLHDLLVTHNWWTLVPKTDTSLVSTSLSTGTTRLYPALASDGTFAFIYVPSAQTVTLVMTVFTKATVVIRTMDPTTGVLTSVGSFANTGTQNVVTSGEAVIVCD